MRTLISLFFTLALLAGGLCFWGLYEYSRPGPLKEELMFTVEKGAGVSAIAPLLKAKNIISNDMLFKVATRLHGNDKSLHAGEYAFEQGISMADVISKLEGGDIYLRQFTVPEGLTSWQVVKLLESVEALEGEIKQTPKEGSLLPQTYSFTLGEQRQDKIEQMKQAMEQTLTNIVDEAPEDAPLLSRAEAVILASIIEKETAVPEERRRIAGVFHNRLKKGMKLQTDPTVIYAITGGKIQDKGKGPLGRRLLSKDLQYESPYNTYKYPGLPPGPIANPGKASIEAAMNPEEHDYLFFVADGTGGHIFAKTLEEHNRNVANWRKIRKKQAN